MIDEKQVKHIADLARIKLKDEEIKKFSSQLSSVMDYMKILEEVDVSNISETSQVTGLSSVLEEDEIISSQSTPEELLNCTELDKDSNQIRVPKII